MNQIIAFPAHPRRRRAGRYRACFALFGVLTVVACAAPPALSPTGVATGIAPPGTAVSGRVTHVRDGDTIEIGQTAIRLANLDCDEAGTPRGERATRRMRDLTRSGNVSCRLSGRKSYDREVGTCRLAGGPDIGAVLIADGLCARWR